MVTVTYERSQHQGHKLCIADHVKKVHAVFEEPHAVFFRVNLGRELILQPARAWKETLQKSHGIRLVRP